MVLRQFAWYKTGRTGAANRPGKSDTPPFHDMQGGERREKMPKSQKIARPAQENSNHTPNFPFTSFHHICSTNQLQKSGTQLLITFLATPESTMAPWYRQSCAGSGQNSVIVNDADTEAR